MSQARAGKKTSERAVVYIPLFFVFEMHSDAQAGGVQDDPARHCSGVATICWAFET